MSVGAFESTYIYNLFTNKFLKKRGVREQEVETIEMKIIVCARALVTIYTFFFANVKIIITWSPDNYQKFFKNLIDEKYMFVHTIIFISVVLNSCSLTLLFSDFCW